MSQTVLSRPQAIQPPSSAGSAIARARDADPAAGAGADDAVGRLLNKQIAYELGVSEATIKACLGDPAEARCREPHAGRDRGRKDCRRPVEAGYADGVIPLQRLQERVGCPDVRRLGTFSETFERRLEQ